MKQINIERTANIGHMTGQEAEIGTDQGITPEIGIEKDQEIELENDQETDTMIDFQFLKLLVGFS